MTHDLPQTLTLHSSRVKTIFMGLICLVFVACGIWMLSASDDKAVAWGVTGFFGLCLAVFILQLIRPGHLTLNQDGFEQVILGRFLTVAWKNVSSFGVIRIQSNKFVSFSRYEDEGKIIAGISKSITGGHSGILGDSFGMKAEKLAVLMNQFRHRALEQD